MNSEVEMRITSDIRVYKYRWLILLLYCLVTIINFMQLMQFTIIADIVSKYYNVETTVIDATGLVFFVIYILMFLPISYLIEKYDLRITAIISATLTLCGVIVKIFCDDPDRIYIVIIGQILCALGQVYLLSIPSKLATTWFGPTEVSTACALAVFGTQLGTALGAVIPPFVVNSNVSNEKIGQDLRLLLICYSVIAGITLVLICTLFRARPKLPPSQSQLMLLSQQDELHFLKDCKKSLRIKDFVLVLLIFGIFNGIWNSFGILVNTLYTNYFPDGQTDIGIITLVTIIVGGCIGSIVFGLILDKTHQFKRTSFFLMFASSISFALMVYTLIAKSRIGTFFTTPLFGFFAASTMVVSYEYALEATYPIPESVSCSILNACVFFFAIVSSFGVEGLLDSIDYLYSFVILGVLMLCCSLGIFVISPKLRRHEANVAATENLENVNSNSIPYN